MHHDDPPEELTDTPPGSTGRHPVERRCILTGVSGSPETLIRLALGPDGIVLPDLRARASGRGAWIACDRAALEAAQAKGKLRGALARAFKTGAAAAPDDLATRIAAGLERMFLDRLGLEQRAGAVVTGSDRIGEEARRGRIHLLLHAADAAPDGNRRLDQALRVGSEGLERSAQALVLPVPRSILSLALGRENVVHIALNAPAAAARVLQALGRWRGFIGLDGSTERADVAGSA
jgi:uncharacterized protein